MATPPRLRTRRTASLLDASPPLTWDSQLSSHIPAHHSQEIPDLEATRWPGCRTARGWTMAATTSEAWGATPYTSPPSAPPSTGCSAGGTMMGGGMCEKRKSSCSNIIMSRSPPSRMLLSPRPRTPSTLSPRTMMGGGMCKKRKSPCSNITMFRSPLSRMLLSPRPRTPSTLSPRIIQEQQQRKKRTSPSAFTSGGSRVLTEIDLNVLAACEERDYINLNEEPEGTDEEQEEENVELNVEIEEENAELQGIGGGVNAGRKEVPIDTWKALFEALLAKSKCGSLEGHETGQVATQFSVSVRTAQRLWARGKKCLDQGILVDLSSGKSRRVRKKKEVDLSKLRGLPISSRSTLEDVSKELAVRKSKLHSMKREGIIERVSNSIKPFLTDKNKKERLKWCISMLDSRSVPHDPIFKGLFDFVFIDEKWFNITRKTERYYKTPEEEQPTRTCKSKNFIPKIMILVVFARPRFFNGICIFDGKIGCFPFVVHEAAKRSSKNRKAGTMEMKPIDSVKQEVSREFLINKVLPAIRAKWPQEDANKPIFI